MEAEHHPVEKNHLPCIFGVSLFHVRFLEGSLNWWSWLFGILWMDCHPSYRIHLDFKSQGPI